MTRFFLRRLVAALPVLVFVSIVVFLLINISPGDAAIRAAGGIESTPESLALAREKLGLDKPLPVRYWDWAQGLAQGELGSSLFKPVTVTDMIVTRLPVTMSLAIGASIIGVTIAIIAGLLSALRPDSIIDRIVTLGASVGIAAPSFFVGLMLILVFSLRFDFFPAVGYVPFTQDPMTWLRHLVLPSVALGTPLAAELARHLRASLRDVMQSDYVRTAVAKGMPAVRVTLKHALKNASIPVVTVMGLQFGRLLGGTVVIERVFAIRGLGDLIVTSVFDRDYPVIQGVALFTVVIVLFVNFLVDISYAFLNPRVRPT